MLAQGFERLLMVVVLFSLIRCSGYRRVETTYDETIDFRQYRTFAWIPDTLVDETKIPDHLAYDKDIIRNNAKNYITSNLTRRGMIISVDSPDVVFQLVLLKRGEEHAGDTRGIRDDVYSLFHFPFYYPYYRLYTWHWNYPAFWIHDGAFGRTYPSASVVVKMFDVRLRTLVWMAVTEGDIYDVSYIHHDVHPAISRIMKQLPPVNTAHKSQRLADKNRTVTSTR